MSGRGVETALHPLPWRPHFPPPSLDASTWRAKARVRGGDSCFAPEIHLFTVLASGQNWRKVMLSMKKRSNPVECGSNEQQVEALKGAVVTLSVKQEVARAGQWLNSTLCAGAWFHPWLDN